MTTIFAKEELVGGSLDEKRGYKISYWAAHMQDSLRSFVLDLPLKMKELQKLTHEI